MEQLIPLLLLVAVFYFLLIRPQQRRARQHRELMSSVGIGDEVITVGGMYGTVRNLDDISMTLEVSPGTSVRFSRQAISRKVLPETSEETEAGESTG